MRNLAELLCVLRVQDHEGLTREVIALVAGEDAPARERYEATLFALGTRLFRLGQMHDFLLVVGVEDEPLTLGTAVAGEDRQHVHEDEPGVPALWARTLDHCDLSSWSSS